MTLDIGCGSHKIAADAVGIDRSAESAADIIWDLDAYPWPLPDSSFDHIHMSHVIEHLTEPVKAMTEVYRVARADAEVTIVTPHFSSHNSYVDPTHKTHLAAGTFRYFTGEPFATFAGAQCRFDVLAVSLTFGSNLVLDNIGRMIAQLSLQWYERHAAWIFPALDIQCRLCARK